MNKQKRYSTVSGGVFLIGLGVLAYSGWWWPGIMFIMGLAASAELILRGKYLQALLALGFFTAVPLLVAVSIPWRIVGPLTLIALGAAAIIRSISQQSVENIPPTK